MVSIRGETGAPRVAARAAAVLAMLLLPAGCGGSAAPRADPIHEARVVAELNAACRSLSARQPHPLTGARLAAARHRLAALEDELARSSAYLPAGRAWARARSESRSLLSELHAAKTGATRISGLEVFKREYRQQLAMYNAERALGLTSCVGAPPRPPIEG